ncbi:hypothetical protein [Thiomonas bhubaneswarensis]|uniref:Helix-turn-helix domain n=1 Tax=Thiomonas bhubaneswarensis TaxID=339866 RepID=A0A0K6I9W7_9BURK|nr:hypothetical protein [Thiomonas bhubaneswarensis]CUA99914.1 hypothetical protein Ga0061069_110153 [Thiomonas bhubaneswarensis]
MAKRRRNAPTESVSGRYVPLPHSVLDSAAFQSCGHMAKALLLELMRQHNGANNGHIRLSRSWLAGRGWGSVSSINAARDELLRNRLIVQTRHGGLRNGSHFYALTWLAVTDFAGLDISPQQYHPGAYLLPLQKQNGCPSSGPGNTAARPSSGPSETAARPPHGPETAVFGASPRPPHGHKLTMPFPTAKVRGQALATNPHAARMAPRDWRH